MKKNSKIIPLKAESLRLEPAHNSFILEARTLKLEASPGFSLIETLVYIFVMTLLLSALSGALLSLTASYRALRSGEAVGEAALVSLERMIREVRGANSVLGEASALGSSPGRLTLNYLDDLGNASTTEFYLNGSTLSMKRDGVSVGPLTSAAVRVSNLTLRLVSGTNSKAVKIEMTAESGAGANYKSRKFYGTAVMRGSYLLQ